MDKKIIEEVRAFNREYTVFIGILNKSFLQSKFSLVETRIIHAVYHKDCSSPSEIATFLNIDKSYLSRILASLGRRKIIIKSRSENDTRSVKISLTGLGKLEFGKINEAANLQMKSLLSPFSENELNILVKNMSEIRKMLRHK